MKKEQATKEEQGKRKELFKDEAGIVTLYNETEQKGIPAPAPTEQDALETEGNVAEMDEED